MQLVNLLVLGVPPVFIAWQVLILQYHAQMDIHLIHLLDLLRIVSFVPQALLVLEDFRLLAMLELTLYWAKVPVQIAKLDFTVLEEVI